MPASTPISGRSPPVRLSPTDTTASNGIAQRPQLRRRVDDRAPDASTTQPEAITRTSRAIAARPGQPSSVRSSHADGFIDAPNERSVASAVNAIRNSTVPISASAHIERRNRTVIDVLGAFRPADAISASPPNMTRIPIVDSTRPSHSAPPVLPSSRSLPVVAWRRDR